MTESWNTLFFETYSNSYQWNPFENSCFWYTTSYWELEGKSSISLFLPWQQRICLTHWSVPLSTFIRKHQLHLGIYIFLHMFNKLFVLFFACLNLPKQGLYIPTPVLPPTQNPINPALRHSSSWLLLYCVSNFICSSHCLNNWRSKF